MSGAAPESSAAGGIGRQAVTGIAWLTADVVIAKLGGTLLQLVLAYLLMPGEIGLFALALSVSSMSEFAAKSGLRDILIKRADEYDRIGGTALWLSIGLGSVSTLLIVVLAGPVAVLLDSPRLEGVLRLVSVLPLINCLGILPRSRLESMFRFRAITVISWASVLTRMVVSIGLAAVGLGVYALIWGLVVSTAVSVGAFYLRCRLPASLRFDTGTARAVCVDMSSLFAAGVLAALVSQGDYFLLGKFSDEAEVGLYYMAFSFSIQVVLVFAMNLNRVMMPALSRLAADPVRQRRAFSEAARALMLLGGPVCLLQAALAEPLVVVALPDAYLGAALPMAILLIGMYFRMLSFASVPLLKSQGRFPALLVCQVLSAFWILVPAGVGAWLAGAPGCALGVAFGSVLNGFVITAVALRDGAAGVAATWSIQMPPLLVGLVAGGAAYAVGEVLPDTNAGHTAHLVVGGGGGMLIYLIGSRVFLAERFGDAIRRTEVLWRRIPYARGVIGRLDPSRSVRARGSAGPGTSAAAPGEDRCESVS